GVLPRVAVRTVVLAHGTPLAFAEIRPPTPPRRAPLTARGQSCELRGRSCRRLVGLRHRTGLPQPAGWPILRAGRHAPRDRGPTFPARTRPPAYGSPAPH